MKKQNLIHAEGFVKRQRGVTLVELLVSVFVFAIGVLGFSALQTRSLQATYDNAQREDVIWMADSLIGRIRSNNFATSDYVSEINGFGTECPNANPPAGLTLCAEEQGGGVIGACSESDLAAYDVWDVLCNSVDPDTDVISNTGGLDAVNGLTIQLGCNDGFITDTDTCSTGSDLTLNFTWCTKSVDAEIAASDCTQLFSQQSYTLVFRP